MVWPRIASSSSLLTKYDDIISLSYNTINRHLLACGIIENTYLQIPATFNISSPLMMHVSSVPLSLALLLGAANIEAFSVIHNSAKNVQKSQLMFTKPEFEHQQHEPFDFEVGRRASAAVLLSFVLATSTPAIALESRNESLCSTGLFEHFQEWRLVF